MSSRRPSRWIVTKFSSYQDEDGRYRIHLDGRKKVGAIRLPDNASESEITRALIRSRFAEFHADDVQLDWLSDSAVNVMAGEEPLYQLTRTRL